MSIAILSVNHQLAPIEIREKVAFDQSNIANILNELYSDNMIDGCAILSTCNRSEVFVSTQHNTPTEFLMGWFAKIHQLTVEELKPYLVFFLESQAISHITRVATGLDSLVLGEPQILGQLKDSYHFSKHNHTLDKILEKLFQHAFSSAKHIRSNTKIGNSPVSVAYCGVKLAQQIFSNLSKQIVLLIGANEMISLSAEHFLNQGVSQFIIANRTVSKAQDIAQQYQAKAISLNQLHQHLHHADIVITATASPVPILGKGLIETALKQRKRQPIFILDIAVPRDVEPEVAQLEDIYLYTVDDLEQVVSQNKETRVQEKEVAEALIINKTQEFSQWLTKLPHEEIIKQYRQNADEVKQELTKQALKKIAQGDPTEMVIKTLSDQLTNKLLHQNFYNIKTASVKQLLKCANCIPNVKL